MVQGYLAHDMHQTAVFEFFVRQQPRHRNFLLAAGVEQVLDDLAQMRISSGELEWLSRQDGLTQELLNWLRGFRFTGEVHAMPEGTVFFANEPVLRVTAPLPQAQLIEARVINRLQFQTMIASKAVRCALAAPGKQLVDYGLRRAHGLEAGLFAARASYLAGFHGTSNVQAGRQFGIPLYGTMAHAFVEAHDSESEAFEHFATANPDRVVLILDTDDTEAAAKKVVALAPKLMKRDITIRGVRIDSGDLAEHARRVRSILDEAGLMDIQVFASGNLDEFALQQLVSESAAFDGFGVGTSLATALDAPALNCAYKLQSYAGQPRRKSSEGKATRPGAKQVHRAVDRNGCMTRDTVSLESEASPGGNPLLKHLMAGGERTASEIPLALAREYVAGQIDKLPPALRSLDPTDLFPVTVSESVTRLAATLDAERAGSAGSPGNRPFDATNKQHRLKTSGEPA
ncbi:MAG: nicotinate phosphoribosyltransferase [Verrucomicrobia bacterium]|nr:nicotinate phosphoribosyltransferase [Verrucomicrobiota bacterium]